MFLNDELEVRVHLKGDLPDKPLKQVCQIGRLACIAILGRNLGMSNVHICRYSHISKAERVKPTAHGSKNFKSICCDSLELKLLYHSSFLTSFLSSIIRLVTLHEYCLSICFAKKGAVGW